MKLIRVGEVGHETPAVVLDRDTAIDVSSIVDEFDGDFFASGGADSLAARDLTGYPRLPLDGTLRIGSPIARPSKIVCVGLNYRVHAHESGMEVPAEPIMFFKSPSAMCGPDDPVPVPPGAQKLDWEVELGVIIGKAASYLKSEGDALDHVAGYAIANDVSERSHQLERGGQWVKGKSAPNFNPLGPWLVTPDELPDGPQELDLRLSVNGEARQSARTSDMIFPVAHLISYISQFMVLEPGDLVMTGTPAGVALGGANPQWLRPGDVMELTIERLGSQRQTVVHSTSPSDQGAP